MPKPTAPNYSTQEVMEMRIRDSQRVRLWSNVYANVVANQHANNTMSSYADDSVVAAAVADLAVEKFDEAWGPK